MSTASGARSYPHLQRILAPRVVGDTHVPGGAPVTLPFGREAAGAPAMPKVRGERQIWRCSAELSHRVNFHRLCSIFNVPRKKNPSHHWHWHFLSFHLSRLGACTEPPTPMCCEGGWLGCLRVNRTSLIQKYYSCLKKSARPDGLRCL